MKESKNSSSSSRQKPDPKKRRMSSSDINSDTSEGLASPVSANNQFWSFFRENTGEIIGKILQSPDWNQHIATRDQTIADLQAENTELRSRLSVAEGAVRRCELNMEKLQEKVTDLTTRSMRDNILVKNIEEDSGENESSIEEKVMGILGKELRIPPAELQKVSVERAHRIGKATSNKKRNIVVKLNTKGKTVVMRHIKNLNREGSIKITEQLPPEIHANRDKLWALFVDAKENGKEAKWNMDQLQIDGRIIRPPKDNCKDINMDVPEVAMNLDVKHCGVTSKNNNHFQGHSVEVTSADQVMPALKALCMDSRVSGASNIMYAYRIGSDRHSIHNWEDDGLWGSGRKIMEALEGKGVFNQLICVTRWSAGQIMGPSRFDMIKDAANSVLQDISFDTSAMQTAMQTTD
jgi:hypothetical protein